MSSLSLGGLPYAGGATYQPNCFCPGGTLRGTNGNDTVHIAKADGLLGALGLYQVTVNGESRLMTKQQLENTTFKLGKGDDTLYVDPNVDVNIKADGGDGNDVLIGGGGNDHLSGGKGNDVIFGGKGRDHLDGGKGHDWLFGGAGNDVIRGGKGRDYIDGGAGFDDVQGGRGRDTIRPDWKDNLGLLLFARN
jgi:Ca2+-binding RTX toxin-like protein